MGRILRLPSRRLGALGDLRFRKPTYSVSGSWTSLRGLPIDGPFGPTLQRTAFGGGRAAEFEQTAGLERAPRTLIVTSRMLDVLGGVGRRPVLNEVKRYELFADGCVATVPLGRADLVIELAENAGARVVLDRRSVGLRARGETMACCSSMARTAPSKRW